MSEDETKMQALGITTEPRTIYIYKTHKYQSLKDAVRYAEIDQARPVSDQDAEA